MVAALLFACTAAHAADSDAQLAEKKKTVRSLACQAGVPPGLALATIEHESRFRNELRGRSGEIGAAQIMPAVAVALGFDQLRLAREFSYNAKAGVLILKKLLNECKKDQRKALMSYRSGPNFEKLPPRVQAYNAAYANSVEQIQKKYAGVTCD
jgi:soluble lytic murein transglycosylase-like protein